MFSSPEMAASRRLDPILPALILNLKLGAADWVSVSGSPSVSWVPSYESTQAEQDGNQYYWENSGRLWRKRFELEQAISAFESAGYPGSNVAVDYSSS